MQTQVMTELNQKARPTLDTPGKKCLCKNLAVERGGGGGGGGGLLKEGVL